MISLAKLLHHRGPPLAPNPEFVLSRFYHGGLVIGAASRVGDQWQAGARDAGARVVNASAPLSNLTPKELGQGGSAVSQSRLASCGLRSNHHFKHGPMYLVLRGALQRYAHFEVVSVCDSAPALPTNN